MNKGKFEQLVAPSAVELASRDERVKNVVQYVIDGTIIKFDKLTHYIEVASEIHYEYRLDPEGLELALNIAEDLALYHNGKA